MSSNKFGQYTNCIVIGAAGMSMVVASEHQLHIHQGGPGWPDSAFRLPMVAITTSSTNIPAGDALTFHR
jgi:hypothetical protein